MSFGGRGGSRVWHVPKSKAHHHVMISFLCASTRAVFFLYPSSSIQTAVLYKKMFFSLTPKEL